MLNRVLLLLSLLLVLNCGVAQRDFQTQLTTAKTLFAQGDYLAAGEQCQTIYASRSARTEELLLGIRSFALAEQPEAAIAILTQGVNSGWLDLQTLLSDTLLTSLHPRDDWQSEIRRLIQLTNGTNEELRARLSTLTERDQYYRRQMADIARDEGWSSPVIRELHGLQRELDSLNLIELGYIIKEHGYPGRSLVGNQGSAAIYIIQRADLATQQAYYPLLQTAAEEYELLRSEFAILTDKMRMAQALPQVYGTQVIRTANGMLDFYSIENEAEVEALRREMGLMPLVEYAKRVGITLKN